jgi:hypothetical protein
MSASLGSFNPSSLAREPAAAIHYSSLGSRHKSPVRRDSQAA